jgi:transposase InsO family protein
MKATPVHAQLLHQLADMIRVVLNCAVVADLLTTLTLCDRDRNRRLVDIQSDEPIIMCLVSPAFLRLGTSQSGATLERKMPRERPPNQSAHTAIMGSKCSIPDDHIAPRRSALFMARSFWGTFEAVYGHDDPSSQSGDDDAEGASGDLLAMVREFLNPDVLRSGLDRGLQRHGVGNLHDLQAKDPRPKHRAFKVYEPGYLHVDVKYMPQMAAESSRRYLFMAIDRATRWVFIRVCKSKTAANARRFLRDLERACPIRIRTVLTDNAKEITDRLFGLRKRAATSKPEFDLLCAALGIEHRLAPAQHPKTNGMVERFNARIEEVLQSHHFRSGEELETTLHRYVLLYNRQPPQSALGSKTPLRAMKGWRKLKPELFRKQPHHLPRCDTSLEHRNHQY